MNNIRINRFIAYFLDILIISIFALLVSKINFVNPNATKYQSTYNEFVEYSKKLTENAKDATNINDIITSEYKSYMYKLEKYGLSYTISEALIIIMYFTLFPFFNNGSTIGQRMMRLKLVNDKNEKPNILILFIRSLLIPVVSTPILYCSLLHLITIPILLLTSSSLFFKINIFLSLIICVYCYIDIFILFRDEKSRSLHDKITDTQLITM